MSLLNFPNLFWIRSFSCLMVFLFSVLSQVYGSCAMCCVMLLQVSLISATKVSYFLFLCAIIIFIHFSVQNSDTKAHSLDRSGSKKEHCFNTLKPLGVILYDKYCSRKKPSHQC